MWYSGTLSTKYIITRCSANNVSAHQGKTVFHVVCVSISVAPVSIYAHAHYVAMDSSPCVPEKTKLILI